MVAQRFGPERRQCLWKADLVHLLEVHEGIRGQLGEDGLRKVERGFKGLAHSEGSIAQRRQAGAAFGQRDGLERRTIVEHLLAHGPDAGADHGVR